MRCITYHLKYPAHLLTYLSIYTYLVETNSILVYEFSCGTGKMAASAESRVRLRYHGGLVVEKQHQGQRTNE